MAAPMSCKTVIHRFESGCRLQIKLRGCEYKQTLATLFLFLRFVPNKTGKDRKSLFPPTKSR